MQLDQWARKWGIPAAALNDLRTQVFAAAYEPPQHNPALSEAGVQSRVRLAASKRGWLLWRNNLGAYHDAERGIHLRYGLCNDSPQLNARFKSGDLIGIAPRIIQPQDVGSLIGQFASIECKHEGWRPSPNDSHEQAQQAWATLVAGAGGIAQFNSTGQL